MNTYDSEFYLLEIEYTENNKNIKYSEYIIFSQEVKKAIIFFNKQQCFPNIIDHIIYCKFNNEASSQNIEKAQFLAIILLKMEKIFNSYVNDSESVTPISSPSSVSPISSPNSVTSMSSASFDVLDFNKSYELSSELNQKKVFDYSNKLLNEVRENVRFWFFEMLKNSLSIDYENMYVMKVDCNICNVLCKIFVELKEMFV